MSVLLAKASELCPRCVLLSHPFRGHECEFGLDRCDCGSMRVFIEMNDFCSKCVDNAQAIVVREPYPSEQKIVDKVRRKSPWLRRELRRAFWSGVRYELKQPEFWTLFCICLMVAAFGISVGVSIWSWL